MASGVVRGPARDARLQAACRRRPSPRVGHRPGGHIARSGREARPGASPVVEPTATGGPAATASLAVGLAAWISPPSSNPVHPATLPAVLFVASAPARGFSLTCVTLPHALAVTSGASRAEGPGAMGSLELWEVRTGCAYGLVGPKNGRSVQAVGREFSQPQTEGRSWLETGAKLTDQS